MAADFIPDSEFVPDPAPAAAPTLNSKGTPDFIPDSEFQSDEEKYGTAGQQVLTGVEGLAKGLAGPVATAAEYGLHKLGVPGLSAQDQAARAETNPWIHGGAETAGFVAPALASMGTSAAARAASGALEFSQAGLLSGVGEAAVKASGLGLEGASTISKIAAAGIRTGAEMAALQAGDETSKLINQDPNQSLGTAAINVGLSGIIGGAGGAVIGAVSPLWKSSMEKIGAPKLIDDAKSQYAFRQGLENGGDVPAAITDELTTRMGEVDAMKEQMGNLKGEALARAMPEVTPENTAKIDAQIEGVVSGIDSKIKRIQDSNNPYLKGAIPKLEFHKQQLLDATEEGFSRGRPVELSPAIPKVAQEEVRFTPIRIDENPNKAAFPWLRDSDVPAKVIRGDEQAIQSRMMNANPQKAVRYTPIEFSGKTYSQKFNALDGLKRDMQGLVNYERNSAEDSAIASLSRPLASEIRGALEDSRVWGDAGDIQRSVNAAIKDSIDAEKDAASKFTSKLLGERVADPAKVGTLVNQTLSGKAGIKTDIMGNYIEHTQKLADTINKIHVDAGLEAPIRMTPTPALDHSLGRSSPGTTLGNWLFDKGLASVAGHATGEAVGAGLGSLIGHPALGAIAGDRVLSPVLTSLAKPLLETASRAESFKGTIDYVASVIKGNRLLSNAAENLFKSGSEIIPSQLIPNMASREKLQKSIEYASEPDNAAKIGGGVGHYLPNHATAAAATAATAMNYLNSLKPTQPQASPLDKPAPIDQMKQKQYERALDIAQQPLLVLKYAKDGTLQAQDVKTLNTIYPNLHSKIVSQVYDEMAKSLAAGHAVPYHQRVSLSLLMGKPLDSTMAQPTLQSIMMSNAPKATPQQAAQGKSRKPTSVSQQKTNAMYSTPSQSREAKRLGQ